MIQQGIIFVNVEKCLSCKTCEIECAIEHSVSKNLFIAIEEKPVPLSRSSLEILEQISIPILCHHCDNPSCVIVCPTSAIKKIKNNIVDIDENLCIGCKSCIFVCPYGILQFKKNVIIKCNLCFEQLEKGNLPRCVQSCPTKALQYKLFK